MGQDCRAPDPYKGCPPAARNVLSVRIGKVLPSLALCSIHAFLHFEPSGHCVSLNLTRFTGKAVRNRVVMAGGEGSSAIGRP